MRRHFGWALASVVSLGAVGFGAASAADMAVKAPPMPAVVAYSWTGCYIGANIGGKSARTGDLINVAAATGAGGTGPASFLDMGNSDSGTFIGGGQVGCNWQNGRVVFGIEADADAQSWRRSQTLVGTALPASFVAGDTFDIRSDWQASLRGRLGYAWDKTLLYATGGAAFTNVRAATNWIACCGGFPAVLASDSKNLVGATVGAGVEYAFWNNLSLGVEGRYSWYGTQTFNSGLLPTFGFPPAGPFTFAPTSRSIRVESAEVMAKLNWKFNSTAVVAKY